MESNQAPQNGEIVYVSGYEFVAKDVRVVDNPNTPGGGKVCRFEGVCTDSHRNDSIRHTAYNGGTYGWRVA